MGNAADALRKVKQAQLTEIREMASLHALRNLVQHNGTEPSKSDVKRYLHAAGLMLTDSFSAAYGLDFQHFRLWDFISNVSLRRWLEYSDDLLQQGEVLGCMVGCIVAHERVVDAIREHTKSQRSRSSRAHNLRDRRSDVLSRDDVNAIEKDMRAIREDVYKEIDQLDNELVAIGVGLPVMDTRRFLQASEPILLTDDEEDGLIISDERSKRERSDGARNAAFMLDYLSRLVRLVEESYPGALKSVKLKMGKKGFWAE